MARIPKPWYRKDRKEWYVTINGERKRLGPDKKEALTEFHKLMSATTVRQFNPQSVQAIFEPFMDWVKNNRAPRTYDFYHDFLESFLKFHSGLLLAETTHQHVHAWTQANGWGDATKRCAIIAVIRAFNWALNSKLIRENPIRGIEKPATVVREIILSDEQFKTILSHVNDDEFRDVLLFVRETGCRPQEVVRIESSHIQSDMLILPRSESKGKRRPRVIYLTAAAKKILARNDKGDGLVFRNVDGKPWTANAIGSRFKRLADEKKMGFRFCLTNLRHTYAHNALKNGCDAISVAELMGHVDVAMAAKVYAKISADRQHMLQAAEKATGRNVVNGKVSSRKSSRSAGGKKRRKTVGQSR